MEDEQQEHKLVHIRVMSDPSVVEDVATKIGQFLMSQGYELIEQSAPRPGHYDPKESRVYMMVR